MSRLVLTIFAVALFWCRCDAVASSPGRLVRVQAQTSEPSCGGTWLIVTLEGKRVTELDWSIETSRQIIKRHYDCGDLKAISVTERIYDLLSGNGERYADPQFLSKERYDLGRKKQTVHEKALLDHALFLMEEYRDNVGTFQVVKG